MTRKPCLLLALLLLLLASACDRIPEEPTFDAKTTPIKMVVVNEGLFTTNTAALSVIYEDGTTYFDIFRWVNHRPLGDVAQSVTDINDKYFVAVNNSRRIEILDKTTFKSVGSIRYKNSGSPRFIAPLNDSLAMVSDLYGQLVVIRTVPPYKELEYIELPYKSQSIEKMTTVRGKIFGAYVNLGLAVIDCDDYSVRKMRLMKDVVPTEITKTCKMQVDANQKLWVLTTPRMKRDQSYMVLNCIDPDSEKVIHRTRIDYKKQDIHSGDIIGMPLYNRVDINPERTKIYFNLYEATKDGDTKERVQVLYTIDVNTHKVERYLPLPGVSMMYGMGVSPEGDACVCDCLDYTAQRGYVRVFPKNGGEVKSYKVGVYPRMIVFPNKDINA